GLERPGPSATVGVMDAKLRDRLAIGLAAVSLVLALGTLMFGRYDPGVRLTASNGRVFITAGNERSIARGAGLAPGMVGNQLNNVTLVRFPQYVYPDPPLTEPSPDPETGEVPQPQPIGVEPAEPTDVSIPGDQLVALMAAPIITLQAIQPWDLPTGTVANGWNQASIFDDG